MLILLGLIILPPCVLSAVRAAACCGRTAACSSGAQKHGPYYQGRRAAADCIKQGDINGRKDQEEGTTARHYDEDTACRRVRSVPALTTAAPHLSNFWRLKGCRGPPAQQTSGAREAVVVTSAVGVSGIPAGRAGVAAGEQQAAERSSPHPASQRRQATKHAAAAPSPAHRTCTCTRPRASRAAPPWAAHPSSGGCPGRKSPEGWPGTRRRWGCPRFRRCGPRRGSRRGGGRSAPWCTYAGTLCSVVKDIYQREVDE